MIKDHFTQNSSHLAKLAIQISIFLFLYFYFLSLSLTTIHLLFTKTIAIFFSFFLQETKSSNILFQYYYYYYYIALWCKQKICNKTKRRRNENEICVKTCDTVCVTVIGMAKRPIQLKEKIENGRECVSEYLKWKDVYNNVPDIHSTEIIDQLSNTPGACMSTPVVTFLIVYSICTRCKM